MSLKLHCVARPRMKVSTTREGQKKSIGATKSFCTYVPRKGEGLTVSILRILVSKLNSCGVCILSDGWVMLVLPDFFSLYRSLTIMYLHTAECSFKHPFYEFSLGPLALRMPLRPIQYQGRLRDVSSGTVVLFRVV